MFGFEPTDSLDISDTELQQVPFDAIETQTIALPFSSISGISKFRLEVWRSIERLYQAAQLAADCDSARWEFAVELHDLLAMGLRTEELRWLVKKDIFYQSQQRNNSSQHSTSDDRAGTGSFPQRSRFIIGEAGYKLFESSRASVEAGDCRLAGSIEAGANNRSNTQLTPAWDIERHELRCAGKLVKKFKWRAANQEAILAAFQKDGWPAHIVDPLAQQPEIDPKRRLADAIKSLNRHQQLPLIRFCGDGTGEGVLWEFKR